MMLPSIAVTAWLLAASARAPTAATVTAAAKAAFFPRIFLIL
jgi:hypothetical protein